MFSQILRRTYSILALLALVGAGDLLAQSNSRIAISSVQDGNAEIYTMDPDGGNMVRLTDNSATDLSPAWSPVGRRIAFTPLPANNKGDIYVMDADGSNLMRLTDTPGAATPCWSPDGRRIAFTIRDLFVIDVDGSNLTRLTNTDVITFDPAWSPDGSQIAYVSWPSSDTPNIQVIDVAGGRPRPLTANQDFNESPAWSPDGSQILFASDRDSRDLEFEIFVMNADGTSPVNLSQSSGSSDSDPAWSPDGTQILFSSNRNLGRSHVFLMNADGSGQREISDVILASGSSWSLLPMATTAVQAISWGAVKVHLR